MASVDAPAVSPPESSAQRLFFFFFRRPFFFASVGRGPRQSRPPSPRQSPPSSRQPRSPPECRPPSLPGRPRQSRPPSPRQSAVGSSPVRRAHGPRQSRPRQVVQHRFWRQSSTKSPPGSSAVPPSVVRRPRQSRHPRQAKLFVARPVPARVLALGDKGTQFYYCAPWLAVPNQVWQTRSAWQSKQISKR